MDWLEWGGFLASRPASHGTFIQQKHSKITQGASFDEENLKNKT